MERVKIYPTSTAAWHALVLEAEKNYGRQLGDELESYLVFLLQRFCLRSSDMDNALSLEFLQGLQTTGAFLRYAKLTEVGDKCLLIAGFYPERAIRLLVPISYFVELGLSAYHSILVLPKLQKSIIQLYTGLCDQFIDMIDTLHCIRELSGDYQLLPLQAEELWRKYGSLHSKERLMKMTDSLPVFNDVFEQNHSLQ